MPIGVLAPRAKREYVLVLPHSTLSRCRRGDLDYPGARRMEIAQDGRRSLHLGSEDGSGVAGNFPDVL
jgi:hypothetical protein